jgi:FkbM family methyltransferase
MSKHVLKRALISAVDTLGSYTFFSSHRAVRSVVFDTYAKRQALVLCTSNEEHFIVHSNDRAIGAELYRQGAYDFEKMDAAMAALREVRPDAAPKAIVDVGANIGVICIPALLRGYFEHAVAIEPDPNNARLLRANVSLNGLDKRIDVIEAAAGSTEGQTLELELCTHNFGDHRIRISSDDGALDEAGRKVVNVPSSTIDALCSNLLDEDVLLWMDTQGFEGFVLQGSRKFLDRRVPLVLEFWPYGMKRSGAFKPLVDNLAHYSQFRVLANNTAFRPITELPALYDEVSEHYGSYTDILVV